MHPKLREKLVGHAYYGLNELTSQVVCIEQFIQEKEKKCASWGIGLLIVLIIYMD